jgi:hypothetical protein
VVLDEGRAFDAPEGLDGDAGLSELGDDAGKRGAAA